MITAKLVLCASMLFVDAPASEQASQPSEEPQAGQSAQSQGAENTDKGQTAAVPPELEVKVIDGVKLDAIEANVVSYTNEQRVRYGLPPLQVDEELMNTAREHAAWMTRTRNMVHTWRSVAENIAMGQPHSSDAVRAWMNSSGHRANILNAGHRRIGVGAYRTENGTIFWCQQFRR